MKKGDVGNFRLKVFLSESVVGSCVLDCVGRFNKNIIVFIIYVKCEFVMLFFFLFK